MRSAGKLFWLVSWLVLGASPVALPADRLLEVGQVRMIVDETGTLRQIYVGPKKMVDQLFLAASCKDEAVRGDRRLWQHSHDVAKPAVTIVEDRQRRVITITRRGVLAYGNREADKTVAYRQRIEVSAAGELACHYEVEILRRLKWGPSPASISLQIPIELVAGEPCILDRADARIVPETWSKEQQVSGSFTSFKVELSDGQTIGVTPGGAEVGQLHDARAWGAFPYLYLSVVKKSPWFGGAKTIERGTKWEINFTLRFPVKQVKEQDMGASRGTDQRLGAALPYLLLSARSGEDRILFRDDFDRTSLGGAWKDVKPGVRIQDNALDLFHSGRPRGCSVRTAMSNLSCRCIIEYDFTLKAGDTGGQTRHSMCLRSRADPGCRIRLHADKAKSWWLFEIYNRGKWVGEHICYYPFKYTFPAKDVKFHVRIESYGNGTLTAWIVGGGIPPTAMPVAVNSVRSWTPFDDGELVFSSSHQGTNTLCHSQWDNIRVTSLPPRVSINELYYRDKLLVEFDDYQFAPEGSWVKVRVRRKGHNASLLRKEIKPLSPADSRILFDTSRLSKGDYLVTATLFDKTGKRIGDSSVGFEKVRDPRVKLEQMRVYIDEDNRVVVDGKPFFPIGAYCVSFEGKKRWTVPHELFAELKAAGFNTVQNYSLGAWRLDEKKFDSFVIPWLDGAAKHGLRVFFDVEGPEGHVRRRRGGIGDSQDPMCGKYDAPAEVAWRVKKVMGHPALLCWYTADEPIAHGRTCRELSTLNRMIKKLDPHHPTVIATCPGGEHCDGYHKFCKAVDILATDHYPMPKEPAHAFRRTAVKGKKAVRRLQAHWAIPQCYGFKGREMTEEEIRLETYLSIVHGAKGIIWWACLQCRKDHPRCWQATKKLAAELNRMSPILLDKDCSDTVHITPRDAPVDVLLKSHDGKRYLIVVNYTVKPLDKVTFSLPGLRRCKSYFDGTRRKVARAARFSDTFGPYQVRMYELR